MNIYEKKKLCVKLVYLQINYTRIHGQQSIKYALEFSLLLWAQKHYVTGDSNDRSREQHSHFHCPECTALLLTGDFILPYLCAVT